MSRSEWENASGIALQQALGRIRFFSRRELNQNGKAYVYNLADAANNVFLGMTGNATRRDCQDDDLKTLAKLIIHPMDELLREFTSDIYAQKKFESDLADGRFYASGLLLVRFVKKLLRSVFYYFVEVPAMFVAVTVLCIVLGGTAGMEGALTQAYDWAGSALRSAPAGKVWVKDCVLPPDGNAATANVPLQCVEQPPQAMPAEAFVSSIVKSMEFFYLMIVLMGLFGDVLINAQHCRLVSVFQAAREYVNA